MNALYLRDLRPRRRGEDFAAELRLGDRAAALLRLPRCGCSEGQPRGEREIDPAEAGHTASDFPSIRRGNLAEVDLQGAEREGTSRADGARGARARFTATQAAAPASSTTSCTSVAWSGTGSDT